MIDLSNPEHREALLDAHVEAGERVLILDVGDPVHRGALRWACETHQFPHYANVITKSALARVVPGDRLTAREIALIALSSPAKSAAIVRALLEGCGLFLLPVDDGVEIRYPAVRVDADDLSLDYIAWEKPTSHWSFQRMLAHAIVPALILRLLACTTREGALAALRGRYANAPR